MKFDICLLIFFLLLCNCSSKKKEAELKENNTSINISFVEDRSLLKERYIHSNGFIPQEGYVATPELATKLAFNVLSAIYGVKEIKAQLPFSINLDNDVWIIEGFIDKDLDGGSAYIEIDKKTGEILKILHSK